MTITRKVFGELYVSRAPDGTLLANMIEGSGPNFDDESTMRGRSSDQGKDDKGNRVNNPDVVMKYIGDSNKASPVSFYGEVVRMTPRGQTVVALQQEYARAATTAIRAAGMPIRQPGLPG